MAQLPQAQLDLRPSKLFKTASVRSLGPEPGRPSQGSCGDITSHHEMMHKAVLWAELGQESALALGARLYHVTVHLWSGTLSLGFYSF